MATGGKAVRLAAHEASQQARTQVFRLRTRELGGLNAMTRPIIEHEMDLAAREAAENVYLAAGYRFCIQQCGRLASPGYVECPSH